MNHTGLPLASFYRERAQCRDELAFAIVTSTEGSTYRKAGAHMLLAADGSVAGLLSGGCLESDLSVRAQRAIAQQRCELVTYDSRQSDDLLWGMGLGCEGAMSILIMPLAVDDYQPYRYIHESQTTGATARFAIVVASEVPQLPLGKVWLPHSLASAPEPVARSLLVDSDTPGSPRAHTVALDGARILVCTVSRPVKLLILGAGPDAVPLAHIAGLMDWQATIRDHRAAYAVAERFPFAARVECRATSELKEELARNHYDAAVVMSHHLPSDEAYLRALADSSVPYIGLLGPAPRRQRLMHELGDRAVALRGRLYGPVGLDIGAQTPQTIALAIAAEIQAVLAGRRGHPFRESAHQGAENR